MSIEFQMSARRCGDCQLCCKLLPVKEGKKIDYIETFVELAKFGVARPRDFEIMVDDFTKPAGQRCPHQRHHKGCAIYERRPFGCRFWSCRWLTEDDTAGMPRPDRVHYVIDCAPDYVTTDEGRIEVVQIWVDPDYPNAHRDPALRAYLRRRGEDGICALVRFNEHDALFIIPPQRSETGDFYEKWAQRGESQHSFREIADTIGPQTVRIRATT